MSEDFTFELFLVKFSALQKKMLFLEKDKAQNGFLSLYKKGTLHFNTIFEQHKDWKCTADTMALADKNAIYMHCLPADISGVSCKEGEVAADVFEKYRIRTYHEAGFKPYIIAAMMFTYQFENPGQVLSGILDRGNRRVAF